MLWLVVGGLVTAVSIIIMAPIAVIESNLALTILTIVVEFIRTKAEDEIRLENLISCDHPFCSTKYIEPNLYNYDSNSGSSVVASASVPAAASA